MNLFVLSCIVLGVLGIFMTIFCIYLIAIYAKLEKKAENERMVFKRKEQDYEEQKRLSKEQEIYIFHLKEEIGVKDRKISRMQRKGYREF